MTVASTTAYLSEYEIVHYLQNMDSIKIHDELLIPAGRHTLEPDEVSSRQRERLVRAMGRCVSERGYLDTTVAEIVRVARTSKTVFYKHFSDKEHCFLETYKQMTDGRIRASLRAAAVQPTWRGKLDVGIAAYFRWMAEHPEVAITTVVEVHTAGRRALEARSTALREWMRTLEGVATLARAAGHNIELNRSAYAAILLTSEAYVHHHALHGSLDELTAQTVGVQALARALFEHGVEPITPAPGDAAAAVPTPPSSTQK
jgi:AcrR family transcriptional regulator